MTVAEFKKWLDEKLPNEKYGGYRIAYIDFDGDPGDWDPDNGGLDISDADESVRIT